MKPTKSEREACTRLAEALLEFAVAYDEGCAERRAKRPREEIVAKAPHAPQPVDLLLERLRVEVKRGVEAAGMAQSRPVAAAPAAAPSRPEKLLLNNREAAHLLGVSLGMIYKLTQPRGPLPAVRFGTAVRFALADVKALVASRRQDAPPPSSDNHT